jgi:hypothetical protein
MLTYLANLISLAEIVNVVSAGVVFLAAYYGMHRTGLSTESCDRRNVSSAVFNLKSIIRSEL